MPRPRSFLLSWFPRYALMSVLLGLSACATGGLQGSIFRQGDVAFRLGPVPNDWRQLNPEVAEADLASLAFRGDSQQITVGVAGRCQRDGDDVPLRSLTQHLYLGFTNRDIHSEEEFPLDGRRALRTEMTAALDGVPKHLVLVVLKKDGCVYDFWRVAEGSPHSGTDGFNAFVAGFQTLK